jgi:hypothetical protein
LIIGGLVESDAVTLRNIFLEKAPSSVGKRAGRISPKDATPEVRRTMNEKDQHPRVFS